MALHRQILDAVLHICRERGGWTFRAREVVLALPDLNAGSVRTHVMSRCCVNAPSHHAHRWSYFRRVRRGVYEVLPACRREAVATARVGPLLLRDRPCVEVREVAGGYVAAMPDGSRSVRVATVGEAVELARGIPGTPRVTVELEPDGSDPVIEAYEKGVDRTLIRGCLRASFEQRLLALQGWMNDTEALRGAARRHR